MKRVILSSFLVLAALIAFPVAQMRVVPLDEEQGHVALGLALRHLGNAGIFMHTTAHPDDENNGLLVMLNRGQGYRTALATATRGNGGQNEIGPEIFEALGVLRTGELAALHRFDGAEQYFTRAVDFGYSFAIEETYEKWGRDEITADYVRLIRMIRPDVIITLPPTGSAGGQHHMASAVITRDAYKLAADPAKYPEQIKEGLRPWQPKKLYHIAGFGFPGEPPPPGQGHARQLERLRPAARQDLQRDRHRSAQHAQVPGHGAAARAARARGAGHLSARRDDDCRDRCSGTRTSLFDGVDTSVMSLAKFVTGARAQGSDRRARRDLQRRPDRAEDLRNGQRRSDAEAAARRPLRGARAAPRGPRHGHRRRRKVRDRFPPPPEGARVPAGGHASPSASRSKRWRTTASSCPGSR